MYKIVTTPDPILVQKAKKVTDFDKSLQEIISGMEETLCATTDPVGVGLAAPQVGLGLQIFQMKPKDDSPVTTYVNPEIVNKSEASGVLDHKNSSKVEKKKPKRGKLLEGCLSIPDIWGHVTRNKEVTLRWQDEKGKTHEKIFRGFPAVIVQHETDHLQGVLFTKHVMEQQEKLYKSHKDDEGNDVFDEVNL
ncbi:MAG: peptide deformylase [Candidatus Levyibacteriota bacterium]